MKRILITLMAVALGAIAIALAGCQKEPEQTPTPTLTLTSTDIVEVSADGTSVSITFTANRDWTVAANDSWVHVSPTSGAASDTPVTVSVSCDPNTTYEDRSSTVVIKAEDLSQSVTVKQAAKAAPVANIPEGAVDLGLSVYWASCNLGAGKPEQSGGFYAWGETAPGGEGHPFDIDHYKFFQRNPEQYLKYNPDNQFGPMDGKTVLEPEDDAAHVNLGGKWRMPTREEMEELLSLFSTWGSCGGINGRYFCGTNGQEIFLPAAGIIIGTEALDSSVANDPDTGRLYYWTSTVDYDEKSTQAWYLFGYSTQVYTGKTFRDFGLPIRPVCDKE